MGPPLDGRLADRAEDGRREEARRKRRRGQVRDGAGRTRVLTLRDKRRVRWVVRMKELGSVRERPGAVDVAERPAQRDRGQEEQDEKTNEPPLHGGAS